MAVFSSVTGHSLRVLQQFVVSQPADLHVTDKKASDQHVTLCYAMLQFFLRTVTSITAGQAMFLPKMLRCYSFLRTYAGR